MRRSACPSSSALSGGILNISFGIYSPRSPFLNIPFGIHRHSGAQIDLLVTATACDESGTGVRVFCVPIFLSRTVMHVWRTPLNLAFRKRHSPLASSLARAPGS